MKKSTVKLVLDTRRTKKDNTYPNVLRITHNLLTRYITTEYSVTIQRDPGINWDRAIFQFFCPFNVKQDSKTCSCHN